MECFTRHGSARAALFLAGIALAVLAPPVRAGAPGLVVTEVRAGGAAARAGIQPDDVLVRWSAPGRSAAGRLQDPADLYEAEMHCGAHGPVTLHLQRAGNSLGLVLDGDTWRLEAWPPAALQASGRTGPQARWALARAALAEKDAAASEDLWDRALERTRDPAGVAWMWMRRAASRERRDPAGATAAYDAALAARSPLGGRALVDAALLAARGRLASRREEHRAARADLDAARAILLEEAPGTALLARCTGSLANAVSALGEHEGALALYGEALAIGRRLEPGGALVATCLDNMGLVAADLGRLEQAEAWYLEGLALRENLDPQSLDVATSCSNLGVLAHRRGDLAGAQAWMERATALRAQAAPESIAIAASYNNLGILAKDRGDLAAAEAWHRKALAIREKLSPGSSRVAMSYNNLGVVAMKRGNLGEARADYQRALEIHERISPGSLEVAAACNNLGIVAKESGDLEEAMRWYARALAIRGQVAPGGLDVAMSHNNLGVVAVERGDLEEADVHYQTALAIRQRLAPDSLALAATFNNLGLVAARRKDYGAAADWLSKSVAIKERLAPDTTGLALGLWDMGKIERQRGKRREALDLYRRAVAALEAQQTRLGGSADDLATFRAQHVNLYCDLADLLFEMNDVPGAWSAMESSRARAFLAMLAERDLVFRDAPAELEQRRREANLDYDAAMAALAAAPDEGQRADTLARLDAIRARQEGIAREFRSASPRLAAMRYPEPVNLAAAQAQLGDGELLLAWMLADEAPRRSLLFAVTRTRAMAWTLDVTSATLAPRIRRWRALLEDPGSPLEDVRREGGALQEACMGPALAWMRKADQVWLLPDGPLWLAPFAAMPDPGKGGAWLGVTRRLAVAPSATVLLALDKEAGRGATGITAFGDPVYRAAPGTPDALAQLPHTRVEVEGIRRLWGEACHAWLGEDATETRFKQDTARAAVLHVAAHALVDNRFPLESAVALTVPEPGGKAPAGDNGLLQAFEVFESVRLSADLVVLSGCETALGDQLAGEGVIGLTRAFQYAGARAVLASLWSVSDESTSVLMERFHRELRAGVAAPEALRRAQQALAQGDPGAAASAGAFSHPCYWAAFVLNGASGRNH